jgi:hypothetical protein
MLAKSIEDEGKRLMLGLALGKTGKRIGSG